MALRFMDGFDIYADTTDVRKGGYERSGTAGSSTFSTSNGRYSGGCLQGSGTSNQWLRSLITLNGTTLYIAFAYYWVSPAVVNDNIISLTNTVGTALFQLRHRSTTTGDIGIYNTAAALVTTATAAIPTAATWYWIELKIGLGTSTSTGSYELRVNGSTVASGTSLNIWGGGTNIHAARIAFGGCNAGYRLDDLVAMDDTGSYMNGFIGDSKIETLAAVAKSNTNDWSGSITDVDDTPNAADGDTTYISSATSGHESLFKMDALSNRPTTIHALQQRTYSRTSDATSVRFKPVCDVRGNRSLGNSQFAPLTNYSWRRATPLERDPAGNAWVYETVRDARFGVRID